MVRFPAVVGAKEHAPAATSAVQLAPSSDATRTAPTGVPPSERTRYATRTAAPATEGSGSSAVISVVVDARARTIPPDTAPVYPAAENASAYVPGGPTSTSPGNSARPSGPVVRVRVPCRVAPAVATATVTCTPACERTLPPGSRSCTTGARLSGTPRTAAAGGPVSRVRLGGVPGCAVAPKATVPTPETTAVTVFGPGAGPSVQTVEARPSGPVDTFSGWTLPPPAVTTQVTPRPATGLPSESRTRTMSGSATEVPTTAAWPSPRRSRAWQPRREAPCA